MSAEPRPVLRKVPVDLPDRAFWITLRQALLLIVSAIERRHLPHLSKRQIRPGRCDVVE